jgi:hypothetical protein
MGFIVMMTISSPQYVWTLFTGAFQTKTGALLSDVQWTITLLIVLQTWLSPLQGFLVDRFGPKLLIATGASLSGLGWVASSYISTLWGLYLTYGLLCGIGTGIVYVGVVGLMVRWFPQNRGFATGVVAAGYGFGAMLTTFPIDSMIKAAGYEQTLMTFGIIFAATGFISALFLQSPHSGEVDERGSRPVAGSEVEDVSPGAMLRTPVFWLMFVMMSMMSTGGLMVITQFKSFSKSFGIDIRPHYEWPDAPIFRLGLGFDRARKHHGACLHNGRLRHLADAAIPNGSLSVRRSVRSSILRLGRNLFVVPLDLDRHVRHAACNVELRFPVHGPRRGIDPRRSRGRDDFRAHRKLDAGLLARHRHGYRHGASCFDCAETASQAIFERGVATEVPRASPMRSIV